MDLNGLRDSTVGHGYQTGAPVSSSNRKMSVGLVFDAAFLGYASQILNEMNAWTNRLRSIVVLLHLLFSLNKLKLFKLQWSLDLMFEVQKSHIVFSPLQWMIFWFSSKGFQWYQKYTHPPTLTLAYADTPVSVLAECSRGLPPSIVLWHDWQIQTERRDDLWPRPLSQKCHPDWLNRCQIGPRSPESYQTVQHSISGLLRFLGLPGLCASAVADFQANKRQVLENYLKTIKNIQNNTMSCVWSQRAYFTAALWVCDTFKAALFSVKHF